MKKFLTTAFAAMTLILAIPTESYAQTNTQPYIDIKTTVEREVTPDELYLQINISEKEYKGKKTLEEMQDTMLGVLKTNHIGVPDYKLHGQRDKLQDILKEHETKERSDISAETERRGHHAECHCVTRRASDIRH